MGTITENFSYREFEKSETADKHGICNVICDFRVRDAIKALTETVLQPLRTQLGVRCTITSGYRCPELNAIIPNSSETSQHQKGEAADTQWEGLAPIDIARAAVELQLPFDQMILYPDFVHFSHKLEGEQRHQILYNWRYKGEKPW